MYWLVAADSIYMGNTWQLITTKLWGQHVVGFSVYGPALGNSLPENICQSDTLTRVKTVLKTQLFTLAYFHRGTVVYDICYEHVSYELLYELI